MHGGAGQGRGGSLATVGSAGLWKRRRSPRTSTGWRPKATRRRRHGPARAPGIRRRLGRCQGARRHPKVALEHGAAPSRKRGQRPPARASRVYATLGHPWTPGAARWAPRPGWTVNEENTVHPGRYFISRPGSRPPGPSDPLRAARISKSKRIATHSSHGPTCHCQIRTRGDHLPPRPAGRQRAPPRVQVLGAPLRCPRLLLPAPREQLLPGENDVPQARTPSPPRLRPRRL